MWALTNRTSYSAGRNWARDKSGVHLWIVAVKATFMLDERGRVTLADEQPAPALAPEYSGEPGSSSLRWDSDLLAAKPCADVLVNAAAHAPGGARAKAVPVTLRVASIDKSIVVHGERSYRRSLLGSIGLTEAQPFVVSPIRYEHAYGGIDARHSDPRLHRMDLRNPIGVGFAVQPERLVNQPAPAIEYPHGEVAALGPAGLGALDASWSPRRELAGTYDEQWSRRQRPLLPQDYNELFASCAPADQRTARLAGGERVQLVNLTRAGLLQFDLPKIFLTFTTSFGAHRQEHRARMTSLIIEPELQRFAIVWQSVLRVKARQVSYLEQTVIREKPYLT